MLVHIIATIIFYLILMVLSSTLLGFLVRRTSSNPELNRLKKEGHDIIKQEIVRSQRANKAMNIIALVLIISFFYLLLHYWNLGVVLTAVILMAGRLPDLLWEIKHGRKVNPKLMDRNGLFYVTSLLPWVALVILYFSLYF